MPLDVGIDPLDPSLIAGLKASEVVANPLHVLLRHRLSIPRARGDLFVLQGVSVGAAMSPWALRFCADAKGPDAAPAASTARCGHASLRGSA
jgi:hypothetical protein